MTSQERPKIVFKRTGRGLETIFF